MPSPRHFGAVPGVPVGATFEGRVALSRAGVHRPTQPGICGSDDGEGAESIVLSGGYGDDAFGGDTVLYTGQGGRDPETNRQVADQPWNGYNAALARSTLTGRPVRVARLVAAPGRRAYRYEGLYRVLDYWKERGQDGFFVWQYRLERLAPDEATAWGETWRDGERPDGEHPDGERPAGGVHEGEGPGGATGNAPAPYGPAPRVATLVRRIVRDTAAMREVKRLHGHACQLCGTRVETPAGPYAEAAHVRPLGAPHDGPDRLDNLLCLCPNCHVRFDRGAVAVYADGRLLGMDGVLRTARGHALDPAHLTYHRAHVFNPMPPASPRWPR